MNRIIVAIQIVNHDTQIVMRNVGIQVDGTIADARLQVLFDKDAVVVYILIPGRSNTVGSNKPRQFQYAWLIKGHGSHSQLWRCHCGGLRQVDDGFVY